MSGPRRVSPSECRIDSPAADVPKGFLTNRQLLGSPRKQLMRTLAGIVVLALMAVNSFGQDGSGVRTALIRGMELPYEVVDGLAIHAGDIILGTAEEVARWTAERPDGTRSRVRNAVPSGYYPSGLFCTWPNGIIPYVIDDSVPSRERTEVLRAIRAWDSQTVLRFVERTSRHQDYLRFTLGPVSGTWICAEDSPGAQVVVVEQPDSASNLLHVLRAVFRRATSTPRHGCTATFRANM